LKVCITNKYGTWENGKTGKGFFVQRLIPELKRLGVTVTADANDKADLHVGIGKFDYKPKSGKRILRLGPCHFNTRENWKALNKRKADSLKMADGVIYQSEWSKKVCHKYLGKSSREVVIFNGCDVVNGAREPNQYKYFVAMARKWLPQKRLRTIIKAYKLANIKKSRLYIFGDVDKQIDGDINGPVVICDGMVDHHRLWEILVRGPVVVHPVYLDACPNSVVEALCYGCRVICTDQGGTREIVGANGTILKDKPWDFKPIDLSKPLKLDVEKLAKAMLIEAEDDMPKVDAAHVDIRNIAGQYKKFFEDVLNG